MTWTIPHHELKVVHNMNDSKLWAHDSIYYEQLKVAVDMNHFESWALGSKCYEKLRVVDDMNDLRSHEFRPQDVMKTLGLRMVWTTQGYGE